MGCDRFEWGGGTIPVMPEEVKNQCLTKFNKGDVCWCTTYFYETFGYCGENECDRCLLCNNYTDEAAGLTSVVKTSLFADYAAALGHVVTRRGFARQPSLNFKEAVVKVGS